MLISTRAACCGWTVLAALSVAACIFDNGKGYEGGGRSDTAGTQATSSATTEPTTTSTTPGTVRDASPGLPDTGAVPLPDASDQ
jgi:hypothetical protein